MRARDIWAAVSGIVGMNLLGFGMWFGDRPAEEMAPWEVILTVNLFLVGLGFIGLAALLVISTRRWDL